MFDIVIKIFIIIFMYFVNNYILGKQLQFIIFNYKIDNLD